jgi:hypothetical protein
MARTSHPAAIARVLSAIAAVLLWSNPAVADSPPIAPRLQIQGGLLALHVGDGTVLRGQALKGTVITLRDRSGHSFELRIDAAEAGPSADIELYDAAIRWRADDPWQPLCRPGPDGRARLLAIENAPSQTGDSEPGLPASFACTAGAKGKCIMRGYRPWATSAAGAPLAPYFEACIRMMRADYCGDGQSNTVEGLPIESWDRLGIRTATPSLPLESAWSATGAVCIARARVPSLATLTTIVNRCPHLAARVRQDCSDIPGEPGGDALLWNSSAP